MIKKKSSFLTFIFSMLPGGGQMYMGFMKEGLSLLSACALIIFLGSWLNISPIMFVLPVIWFYSFFDAMNKMSLTQEQLEKLEDKYLFQIDKLPSINPNLFSKYKLYIALLLIFVGLSILWNNMLNVISAFLPGYMVNVLYRISDRVPQLIVSLFIIYVGIKLISGKKEELKSEKDFQPQDDTVHDVVIQEIEIKDNAEEI
ncbi:hypothetical protein EDD66_103373 [Mobilisporobacter senegalensis]|uniref:TM2 domain-containing protein n=1 Tax=Mobilisporobacter senegalensis TaxID=1329262 RepID=A0A3N1XS24_9FIRM|nr:hypothetical protein [Mobilisporobacter senegalensis]ROR29435.1 hypothetical protein EDD66_103373 [Mobilisporobacter senegalensis]